MWMPGWVALICTDPVVPGRSPNLSLSLSLVHIGFLMGGDKDAQGL